jgi:hypothetical protein
VNQMMLDAISAETGQCVATVTELAERTGLAVITIKQARQRLVGLGLWIAERGVYVPMPLGQSNQATADPALTGSGKGMYASALYRSMCEPRQSTRPMTAARPPTVSADSNPSHYWSAIVRNHWFTKPIRVRGQTFVGL